MVPIPRLNAMTLFGRQNLVFARAQEFNKPRGFCGIAPLPHRILRVFVA
jgi:hypothetical protein